MSNQEITDSDLCLTEIINVCEKNMRVRDLILNDIISILSNVRDRWAGVQILNVINEDKK